MKTFTQGLLLSAAVVTVVTAGGYKIPEQSINSMALGAAYVAHTSGADTAYYNPANMAFMEDKQYIEGGLTLATLPSIDYRLQAPFSGSSNRENIIIPNLHYVSNAIGNFRWGVSLTAPAGLSKQWKSPFQKAYAKEFTLKVIELSPSLSYAVSDYFSIGAGVRLIYSDGVVKSDSSAAAAYGFPVNIARDMDGNTVEFGYNLAVSYKPTEDIILAATYRSKVDMKEDGTATLSYNGLPAYHGDASVSIPLPAALNLAVSKTWNDTFTLEFDYERTFWSAYKTLDFNYPTGIGALTPAFDDPISKDWEDTNTYRIGATMVFEKLTMMMGVAIDETPVPDKTIGFELPDSDATIVSLGFRYQQTKSLSWGAAFLYDTKESRTLWNKTVNNPILNNGGSFSGGGAYLTTIGLAYEF